MGWCEFLTIRFRKILKDCRKTFRDEWKFFVCLGASGFSGAFVASLHGWKIATHSESWWQILSAVATTSAVVVSLVLARRSETLTEAKEKKYGELLARRIYHDLETLKQAMDSLEPALGAVDSDPKAVLTADQAAFWEPIKNAERDISLESLDAVFDRLDTLPQDVGLSIAEVIGRVASVVEDCKVLVQMRRGNWYLDFARVRGNRAFREVHKIKLLLAKSISVLSKYREPV